MKSTTDKVKLLESSISQQQRIYDNISNIYDQLRLKALALIAGEVAMVTFIYTGWDTSHIQRNVDRAILFFLGVGFLSLAFCLLLWVISTVQWIIPHDLRPARKLLHDKNYPDYQHFLIYLHDDYIAASGHCSKIVDDKCKKFNWCIYLLATGAIIMMIIKFGGH